MILQIDSKTYDMVGLNELGDKLTATQVIRLQRQITLNQDLTGIRTIKQLNETIREIFTEAIKAGKVPDTSQHPEGDFLAAVAMWATRTVAGEDVTLTEAVEYPAGTVVQLIPEDDYEGKALAEMARAEGTSPNPAPSSSPTMPDERSASTS